MGIRVYCPNGHKLNVKSFLAGKRGVCPHCGAKFDIPAAQAEGAKSDASDEKVHSVGKVSAGTATATAPSTSSAELRASHLAKGAAARHGMPTAPVAPVTPVGQVPSAAPITPGTGVPVATVQVSAVQVSAVQPGTAPVSAVPVGAAPVSVPVTAAPHLGLPGVSPLGLAPVTGVPATGVPTTIVRPAVPDPLAEAPEASWYVRPPSGGQYGPAKPHTMREWMAQGRITADSLVWREGWPDWKLAGATFPSLGGPAGGTPAGAPLGAATASTAPAADDPFAALGPGPSVASTLGASRRGLGSRRSDGSGRVVAITVLCLALVVLSALLVYVLNLR